MQVTNINGTTDSTCRCKSWLDHWVRFSGQALPKYCPEVSCTNPPTVGAHVQKTGSLDWYIVPLCERHNASRGTLTIPDFVPLASANVAATCGTK